MANKQGDFIWYELLTDDADAAQAFYGNVLGWRVKDSGVPNMDYRILQATDPDSGEVNPVGGLMQITPQMKDGGARPLWLGYIAVDDVGGDFAVADFLKEGLGSHGGRMRPCRGRRQVRGRGHKKTDALRASV